jgi:hypothetical protein
MAKIQPIEIPPYTNYPNSLTIVIEKIDKIINIVNELSFKVSYLESSILNSRVNVICDAIPKEIINPKIKIIKKDVESNA